MTLETNRPMQMEEEIQYTVFQKKEHFLDALLTDGGQGVVRRLEGSLVPPSSWPGEKIERQMFCWGNAASRLLGRNSSFLPKLMARCMRITDVSRELEISSRDVHTMISDGDLGAVKINGHWWIYKKSLEKLLNVRK
jgi:hypothetical protein